MKPLTTHSSPDRPGIRVKGTEECLDQDWHGQNENVWVDVQAPTPEQIETLKSHSAFNWLALNDALDALRRQRIDLYMASEFSDGVSARRLSEAKE